MTRPALDRAALLGIALVVSLLSACATAPKRGGYFEDDGPGASPPANLDKLADAEPRVEPLNRAANSPYSVFGREYVPFQSFQPYRQEGIGSWYGRKFHGQRTSSGERYDMYAMTAAHPTLPIPSYARVTNLKNGRSVIVRINDRGPFLFGRIIDLSYAAAYKLGYVVAGSAPVEVEAILPDEIRATAAGRRAPPVETARAGDPAAPASGAGSIFVSPGNGGGVPAPAETSTFVSPAIAAAAPAVAPPPPADDPAAAPQPAQALAAPAASADEAIIPVATEPSGIYLQLGAFSAQQNAESLRVKIYQQLTWLNQAIRILHEDGLFRLRLGPYADRSEAMGVADRIRDSLELKPVVVVH